MSKLSGHRILLVAGHYCPLVGGAQAVYDALARELPDTIQVLTSKRDYMTGEYVEGADAFDAAAPYKITRIDRMRTDMLQPCPSTIQRLRTKLQGMRIDREVMAAVQSICERDQIDIVIFGASGAMNWLPIQLSDARFMQCRKLIYYAHGEEISQLAYSEKSEKLRVAALRSADAIVAVSSFTRDLLIDKFGIKKDTILTLPNGVNFAKYSAVSSVDVRKKYDISGSLVVIGAGRMVERKGFDNLVKAWSKVMEAVPNAKLLLAGTGPEVSAIGHTIEARGLSNNVRQLGFVDDADLIALYGEADVFCMPNRTLPDGDTEGFGLVFLEAAAAGTPGIGGRAGGVVDAIIEGETGFLVDSTNVDSISEALIKLLTNRSLRADMSEKAQMHARNSQWSVKARELLAFLGQITGTD